MGTKAKLRKIIYFPMKLIPKGCCVGYQDKVMHAVVGTIIYLLTVTILSAENALLVVMAIALTKESLNQFVIDGTADIMDFIATVIIPMVLYIIIV